MGKKVVTIDRSHEIALSSICNATKGKCACCVIITCSQPSDEGKMEVEMSFEGEETLAAFLIENAMQVFDEKISRRDSK